MIFQEGQHIHFIGVGGFGMSAIARVLLERGYRVSGSDRTQNALAAALEQDGATIYEGHKAAQIEGADMLITSSAVPEINPELAAAKSLGVPVYKRLNVLSHLIGEDYCVAVAGTHGKTTTTAMITHLLRETALDPSYIVGGVMANTGTNAGNGGGYTFVIEADEYDNAFLGLYPDIAVITNMEHDHPDFFKTPDDLKNAFRQFLKRLKPDHGILIACADDAGAMALLQAHRQNKRLAFTYGLSSEATLRAQNIEAHADGTTSFDVVQGQTTHGRATLTLPGAHNIQNALAALYVCAAGHDQPFSEVIPHLQTFRGTGRRFDLRGEVKHIAIVDDYAHHPTAIRATIAAARVRYPGREIWVVWQPHTYSRTQTLWDDYLTAFDAADHVRITDIYAAREAPVDGVSGEAIAAAFGRDHVRHTGTLEATTQSLVDEVQSPAAVLILSAGDAPQIGINLLEAWSRP